MTPQYLSVRLEEKVTQEFLVNVNYGSSQPGKGYEVGSQTASPEKAECFKTYIHLFVSTDVVL